MERSMPSVDLVYQSKPMERRFWKKVASKPKSRDVVVSQVMSSTARPRCEAVFPELTLPSL